MSPQQQAEAQIAAADGKATALAGIAGTMLTLASVGLSIGTLPGPVRAGGWTAAAVWLTAVGVLLLALRPNLNGDHGFVRWARMTHVEIRADLRAPDPIGDTESRTVAWLSQASVRKHRRVRLAVDLLLTSPAAAILVALTTWLL
ncbi:Pycsar system effector family protein [Catenuloplanes sp. NPDC051500]|uniref:Pycsar system effector family protein n=1 Tax=Catenuloplanes sp. NPDC051500 TaxID=3363959 RepID=UPI0037929ABF